MPDPLSVATCPQFESTYKIAHSTFGSPLRTVLYASCASLGIEMDIIASSDDGVMTLDEVSVCRQNIIMHS